MIDDNMPETITSMKPKHVVEAAEVGEFVGNGTLAGQPP
jgi:hypothetical protein